VIGGLMAAHPQALHRIYAANLAGSAVGCLAILPVLAGLGGEGALLLSAAAGLIAALLMVESRSRGWHRWANIVSLVAAAGALLVAGSVRPEWAAVRLSPYKGLTQALLAPGAEHAVTEWTVAARFDVVESQTIHIMPGLSQNALVMRPPEQIGLTLDGDNLQPITGISPEDETARELAENVPQGIIRELRPDAKLMLILEPAGGWDVLMALANGAPSVTSGAHAVATAARPYASLQGVHDDPRVCWSHRTADIRPPHG
jgi:hypothetical protein